MISALIDLDSVQLNLLLYDKTITLLYDKSLHLMSVILKYSYIQFFCAAFPKGVRISIFLMHMKSTLYLRDRSCRFLYLLDLLYVGISQAYLSLNILQCDILTIRVLYQVIFIVVLDYFLVPSSWSTGRLALFTVQTLRQN